MSTNSSDEKKLEKLFSLMENTKILNEAFENEILFYFESMGKNALKVLKEKKLTKIVLTDKLFIWEVKGRSRTYIIIDDNFCECTDFQIRVLGKSEKTLCYHLLAKRIGEKLELFNTRKVIDKEYDKIIESRMKK